MKNILVPTDFSSYAEYATDIAVQVAKRNGAAVHLMTSLFLPYHWKSLPETERVKYKMAQEEIRKAELALAEQRQKHDDVDMVTSWSDSDLLKNISEYVLHHQIDLIVMGSHGEGGRNELFIGSITQKVVRTVHCPVLIIKNPIKDFNFKRVIFASDFQFDELSAFEHLLDFVKPLSPEIHLVAVRSSPFQSPDKTIRAAMRPFKKRCGTLVCKTHIFMYFSVSGGVQAFAKKVGADLLAVSNHHRHPMKRMLLGSTVELLVNQSELPVLTIDFTESKLEAFSKNNKTRSSSLTI